MDCFKVLTWTVWLGFDKAALKSCLKTCLKEQRHDSVSNGFLHFYYVINLSCSAFSSPELKEQQQQRSTLLLGKQRSPLTDKHSFPSPERVRVDPRIATPEATFTLPLSKTQLCASGLILIMKHILTLMSMWRKVLVVVVYNVWVTQEVETSKECFTCNVKQVSKSFRVII